jgi:multiple sugar transport system permease protein
MFFIVPSVCGLLLGNRSPLNRVFVFLDNYIAILKNSAFLTAAKNTAVFSAVAVPLAVILSLCLALLLEGRIPLKSQFRTFFLSPLMVPVASIVLIWQVIFHFNGALNEILGLLDPDKLQAVFGVSKVDWLKASTRFRLVTLFYGKLGSNMILFMRLPREHSASCGSRRVEGASRAY